MCRPVDDGVKMNDMSDDQGNDDQDTAEGFDEEMVGTDRILSEDAVTDFPPERPRGLPFADADITDESVADRAAQENPDVWPNDDDDATIVDEDGTPRPRGEIPVDPAVLDDLESDRD